jgi:hypothetical protein
MITKKELIRKGFRTSSLMSEQEEEKEMDKKPSGNSEFAEMTSLLFHSQTQVHMLHLQTTSYSEHKALQNYYEGIDGLIDGLVESFQGKYGIINGYKSYDIDGYKSTESTIKYLQDLCGKVEDLRDCCDDSYIQNQIDTVCELINSTLYKLRFLK